MATSKNLNTFTINKVESLEVYNYMKENNLINDDELYLVQGDNITGEYDFFDVTVPVTGSVTITDSRITSEHTGEFIPDCSVSDLISNVIVTCTNGSATVTGNCSYPVFGILKIK